MNTPQIDDGGPAFPAPEAGNQHFGDPSTYMGLTLRDWFAGHAMQQFVAQRDHNNWAHERFAEARAEIARAAYNIADAMIAARKPQP